MPRERSMVTGLLEDTPLLEEIPACSRQIHGGIFMVVRGPDRGLTARLGDTPVSFGSGGHCTVVLSDTTVSRRHFEAALVGDEVIVTDFGSRNGCLIHGLRVERAAIGFGT